MLIRQENFSGYQSLSELYSVLTKLELWPTMSSLIHLNGMIVQVKPEAIMFGGAIVGRLSAWSGGSIAEAGRALGNLPFYFFWVIINYAPKLAHMFHIGSLRQGRI